MDSEDKSTECLADKKDASLISQIILASTFSGVGRSECTLIERVAALNSPVKGVGTHMQGGHDSLTKKVHLLSQDFWRETRSRFTFSAGMAAVPLEAKLFHAKTGRTGLGQKQKSLADSTNRHFSFEVIGPI
jgi:hypothetical protein